MFKVPQSKMNEFAKLFRDVHRVQISGSDVFFANIRMLKGRHRILDMDTFNEYYKNFTADIELVSSPIDSFIPYDKEPEDTPDEMSVEDLMNERLFIVNREVPEYKRIQNRVTLDELKGTLNETHPVMMALAKGEVIYEDIVDDIFIYWAMYQYIKQIEIIHIQIFSNMKPLMEYIVKNMTEFDFKRYLRTDKVNEEKAKKLSDMMFFKPEYRSVCNFYLNEENVENNIPYFDLKNLVERLLTNVDITADSYIALGCYLIADFAITDFKGSLPEKSECEQFVRNVLSVI